MSQEPISLSPDLRRLKAEGYEVVIQSGHLAVRNVPYVNQGRQVKYGTLVSTLCLSGRRTQEPDTHVVYFAGEYPCHQDGRPIEQLRHQTRDETVGGIAVNHSFSNRPPAGFKSYHEKVESYVNIISGPAQAIDPTVTARTGQLVEPPPDRSVFNYIETASGRAGISSVTGKLERPMVAIVGLGGTGAYVLDLVAKTPVGEIHVFDGDLFLTHNAFRAPGAPSLDELEAAPTKVTYLSGLYSKMHRHIVKHEYYIDGSNADELRGMECVFLCIDDAPAKGAIVAKLEELGLRFIDVGMGIELVDDALCGIIRVTTSTPTKRDHVRGEKRIPLADAAAEDLYQRNIQIADLNALNAALAVIRWKKLCGFYHDFEREHHSTYTIDGNLIINDDQA